MRKLHQNFFWASVRFLVVFLLFPWVLIGTLDHSYLGDSDPTMFHHVNVITGNLNYSSEDTLIRGALRFPILRSYSSSGALERSKDNTDIWPYQLQKGWLFQGGWSIFSHVSLIIENLQNPTKCKAYQTEQEGSRIIYEYDSHDDDHVFLKAKKSAPQISGSIGARKNAKNNLLIISKKHHKATLLMADGGKKEYDGESSYINIVNYYLKEEILPSKHKVVYTYKEEKYQEGKEKWVKKYLSRIVLQNPHGNKDLSWINFSWSKQNRIGPCLDNPLSLKVSTSDNQQITYQTRIHEKREYLVSVESPSRPKESIELIPGRKGIGGRVGSICFSGKDQFIAQYYTSTIEDQRVWYKKPRKKPFHIDKVSSIQEPVGTNGEMVQTAQFTYYQGRTDVRDSEGLLISYFHDGEKLLSVKYFDKNDTLHCELKFFWEGSLLRCKALFDKNNIPYFARSFVYQNGDIVEESLWGKLTGYACSPLSIDGSGSPFGAECHTKKYTYYENHLLKSEHEDGIIHEYFYKEGTDLLEKKLTKDSTGRVLIRHFFEHDSNHLLIQEIEDDSSSLDPEDYYNATQRKVKTILRDACTGLPIATTVEFLDLETSSMILFEHKTIRYNKQLQVEEESFYDKTMTLRYTNMFSYNSYGEIVSIKNELGECSRQYDCLGRLVSQKEFGSPEKKYTYDNAGRILAETIPGNTLYKTYDSKGRVLTEADESNNITYHSYDEFGNRLSTHFSPMKDANDHQVTPAVFFETDLMGNIICVQNPLGSTTRCEYNLLRKPTYVCEKDGTETTHYYETSGLIKKTIYPNGSVILYEYDPLKRLISKKVFSKSGELLNQENWLYGACNLLSYTNSEGLTTNYLYDGGGRKIAESASSRKTRFTYDALGFLERVEIGDIVRVEKHNFMGQVTETWDEDTSGRIENHTQYFYDNDGRKVKTMRSTQEGIACDHFEYMDGKLSKHTDPFGEVTQFLHNKLFINDLNQKVLQKTTIDPLQNRAVELYDAGGRKISTEHKDPEDYTVGKETFHYDILGNLKEKRAFIYNGRQLLHTFSVYWEYDQMGRIIKENEQDEKVTHYEYDRMGRIIRKQFPNFSELFFSYDDLGRRTRTVSSDGCIDYRCAYDSGANPVLIQDHYNHINLDRKYNEFGELIEEISSSNMRLSWDYDNLGRKTLFVLPDGSSVQYKHQGLHLITIERKSPDGVLLYSHNYTEFDSNGHVSRESPIFDFGEIQTSHDLLERPSKQSSPWQEHSVSYGPSGLVTKKSSSLFPTKHYTYDALNQLQQEGDKQYHFDSLGNPRECEVNILNQITLTDDFTFAYDRNGNLLQKAAIPSSEESSTLTRISNYLFPPDTIEVEEYKYDQLNRLVEIIYPNKKRICFIYDPLSRLYAKKTYRFSKEHWACQEERYYVYDQEFEVGSADSDGLLIDFKVLGLGIQGDIGASVALEINNKIYLPVHDFSGSIVAIVNQDGNIHESYDIDSFGKSTLETSSLSPWRFCSKREEHNLIFFGLRFYDPSQGRWLTPDPSGYTDSSNLYLYVLNSPMNRLDLFGLSSEDAKEMRVEIIIPTIHIVSNKPDFWATGSIDGIPQEFFIIFNEWHKLQFTPEENKGEKVNLLSHLHEIIPSEDRSIVLSIFINGIGTNTTNFETNCKELGGSIGGLLIGLYNPTEGLIKDVQRTFREIADFETPMIAKTRQFLSVAGAEVSRINPSSLIFLAAHSEGGLVLKKSIQGALPDDKARIGKIAHLLAIGPAECIPKGYGITAVNLFSEHDFITGKGALNNIQQCINDPNYDIRVLKCESKGPNPILAPLMGLTGFMLPSEKTGGIADHAFTGTTYMNGWKRSLQTLQRDVGFYRGTHAEKR